MAIQTTNPLILLQGRTPDIAPAMNQLLAADLPGIGRRKRENKLMQTKVGSEQMRAKIETAALISESLLPALEAGDMASATKLLNDVKGIDPELANEGLTLLQSDPEKLKTLSRQAIDTYKRIQAQSGQNIVGAPFKLETGNMGYLSKTGQVVDTGKPFFNEYKNVNIGDVPSVFNPKTGQFSPAEVGSKPVTAGDVAANRAEIAGAEQGAKSEATSQAERNKASLENSKVFSQYEAAIKGLKEGLAGSQTGPIAGRIPAITAEQQIAEGSVSAIAPVLKQLFRSAGEGIFTDKDQELLLKMIPTRTDHPAAREAKLANIDAIVRAKLGMPADQQNQSTEIDDLINQYAD